MNYEVYSEESNIINHIDFMNIKKKISTNMINREGKDFWIRKIYFNREINYLNDSGKGNNNIDIYSINIKDNSLDFIMLEKKSYREGLIHKNYTYIPREQCDSILAGDIRWMKDNGNHILYDLYLQMTINKIKVGVVVDYQREVYRLNISDNYFVFDKVIKSTYDIEGYDLFDTELQMSDRLEKNKTVMTYRQSVNLPRFVTNVLQIGENVRLVQNA